MTNKLTIGSLKPGSSAFNRKFESSSVPAQTSENFIEIQQHQNTFKIKPDRNNTVLNSALNQEFELDYKCKKGTCGKCRVKLLKGNSMLTSVNEAEKKKLGKEIDANYRLACQAVFK
ncbi:2Fe-2S iron-sulfur cluster-binding protein [Alteribacillus bidgolensis]|uniref:Ferredoxin n=1 Tax=Alteribacillus bidgolensis TaxID=930129 RepID=A0A1G8L188_9BACI|nr:2Fe-2S iron-sulfur cluster-binding protein [Alteribacillus bidgolensis]SDI49367.1 Ferredoxin [Alteribacillus bidgolensis]